MAMGSSSDIPNEVRQQLDNVNFPVTKNELVDKVGSQNVNMGGRNLNMRDIINRLPKDRFNSKDELINELKNVPEMKGQTGGQTGGTTGGGQTGGQTGMGGGQQTRR